MIPKWLKEKVALARAGRASAGATKDAKRASVIEGVRPIYSVDSVTGKRYLRFLGYAQDVDRWSEWYSPSGTVLLRMEYSGTGRMRVAAGSIEAVRAANPGFFTDADVANYERMRTDIPFDCMAGCDHNLMRASLEASRAYNLQVFPKVALPLPYATRGC